MFHNFKVSYPFPPTVQSGNFSFNVSGNIHLPSIWSPSIWSIVCYFWNHHTFGSLSRMHRIYFFFNFSVLYPKEQKDLKGGGGLVINRIATKYFKAINTCQNTQMLETPRNACMTGSPSSPITICTHPSRGLLLHRQPVPPSSAGHAPHVSRQQLLLDFL